MTAGTRTLSQIADIAEFFGQEPRPVHIPDDGRLTICLEALRICADRAVMSSTRADLERLIAAVER